MSTIMITNVQGSDPSSSTPDKMGKPSKDDRGTQSLRITGTGFARGMYILVSGSPKGLQAIGFPHTPAEYGIQEITDHDCYAAIDIPETGQYAILAGVLPASPSDAPAHSEWFHFTV